MDNSGSTYESLDGIAIVGMSGRFPGAKNVDEFWRNLQAGVESISVFSDRELEESGVEADLLRHPHYVKAGAFLEGVELFDASFFGFNPKEAAIADPQHRLFLECAWEALESAGYNSENYAGSIGVYGGCSFNSYFLNNLYFNSELKETVDDYQIFIANDKDFLPTRVSYKLNLKGPSVTVQTACSTSLVAVSMACQSLLNYQCDMALAGGVSISVPQKTGYLYREGMILSPDGHCRAFDAKAQGTVGGSGVGIVVLKRLEEAIADGDCIHAVIKGFAINNDGSLKIGYTAPSVEGQAEAIAQAQAMAEVEPETISYIEAHGTGTPLGDPIEIAALTQAFRASTQKKGFCAIGSAKTNIGHLDAAAGVTGLIKTVQALKHQLLPPTLHYEQPNPKIDFANSPFYVNATLSEWKRNGTPRRAGVSSFGIGGTNAHVVLEEAPIVEPSGESRPWQLLILSAKTRSALETATANLAENLKQHSDVDIADVAYTLQVGRKAFNHRRMLVCRDVEEAAIALATCEPNRVFTDFKESKNRPVTFMFSGQGSQYVNMGLELYQSEPIFREEIDRCSQLLKPHLGLDLREVLYPTEEQTEASSSQLKQTSITQPALFAIEYAIAKLWMSWGVNPSAAIGHSIGEYVAATLAGVFSLENALSLVAARGRLMQQMPSGVMLAVPLSELQLQPFLNNQLSLATINGPSNCVVSGSADAVDVLQAKLLEVGVEGRRLHTSHAFHSHMMEPILEPFTELVKQVHLQPPTIPFVSNVTGTWITASEATNPSYWARHLRQTVLFSDGLKTLFKESDGILLEIGPGRTLSTLAKQHPDKAAVVAISSLRHPQDQQTDLAFLLNALGKLWLAGVHIDWSGFYADEQRHRLPLPTYPFERQRYWIDPPKRADSGGHLPQKSLGLKLWQSLLEASRIQAQQELSEFDNPDKLEQEEWLDRLCSAYVNCALQDLGAFRNPLDKYSIKELLRQFDILPRYQQLLSRCLQALVELEQLQQREESFTNLQPFSKESIPTLVEEVRTKWTDLPQLIDVVERSGGNFAAILTGKKDPLELLFTGPTFESLKIVYEDSPDTRYYSAIVRAGVQAVVQSLPPGVKLRILEIGAGTGATTSYVLAELSGDRAHYTFTDIGPLFLKRAQQKFSTYPFIEYRLLDIDRDPQEQGFESHSFDIVIAANVLHATPRLGKTLQHVRSLVAPDGILLVWETTPSRMLYFDVSFPLLQPFEADDLRSTYPFLSKEQWQAALQAYGFSSVAAFPESDTLNAHIFAARASSSTALSAASAFTQSLDVKEIGNAPDKQSTEKIAVWKNNYVAPRNQLEAAIAELWEKCLGLESLSIHDNFFDLGGDSLLAVHLLEKIRETLEMKLPSHSLLNAPTIAELAKFIEEQKSHPDVGDRGLLSCLVEIQRGRFKQPLFLIHPAGGQVYFYRDLARELGSDWSVYGLQARGIDGKTAPHTRIEEMAAYYIEALRVVQPEGPYFLGGSSFGGIVAFEMAQQLRSQSQKVALLTLIDSPVPEPIPSEDLEDDEEATILAFLLSMDGEVSVSADELRQLEPDERVRYFLEKGKHSIKLPADFGLEQVRFFLDIFKLNLAAIRNYTPRNYPGQVIFFRARERHELTTLNPEGGWQELAAGGVASYEIPGNHITMNFPPNVGVMAEKLRAYLDEARQFVDRQA